MMEAVAEMAVTDAKSLLTTASSRAETLNRLFNQEPEKRVSHAKEARETESMIIRATGNWRESMDITLRPGVPLPPADRADADLFTFAASEIGRAKYPELEHDLEAFFEERLMAELEMKRGGDLPPLQIVAEVSELPEAAEV